MDDLIFFILVGSGLFVGILLARIAARIGGVAVVFSLWLIAVFVAPFAIIQVEIAIFGYRSGDGAGFIAAMLIGVINVFLYVRAFAFFSTE